MRQFIINVAPGFGVLLVAICLAIWQRLARPRYRDLTPTEIAAITRPAIDDNLYSRSISPADIAPSTSQT